MLDDALHRVALNVLDDGHLAVVAELDVEQGVALAQGVGGLLQRELDERGLRAAGVNGGRDQVGDAHATGRTLAEFVTNFTFKHDGVCHSDSP